MRGNCSAEMVAEKDTCFASVIRLGTSVIRRLAASAVADFAAAKTVDAEMLILPALDTFFPRKPPNERVFDFKVENFSEHKDDGLKTILQCKTTSNQQRTSHR
jgi:hypothetical protein